jgi:ribonuclease D
MIEALQTGHGPIAIDAERASGYRYSQRAYLIQIFRRGGGLHLIDPIAVSAQADWAQLGSTFADEEWIIHASTQDLPCLRELGLTPRILFDTELGSRIAGSPRAGLGPLCSSLLGFALAKEHSAVDWSTRPLKEEWLTYAALDVDVLVDLRDEVEKLLASQGKLEWAQEEFAAILTAAPNPPRKDPWRRTSGMHKVRDRMTLALIRAMWQARDEFAQRIDISPGRIFNDEVLLDLVTKRPAKIDEFTKIVKRRTRVENLPTTEWFTLFQQTLTLSADELPEVRTPALGLPPLKVWRERNPMAHARITHAKAALQLRAAELGMPTENLLSPEYLRQLMWKNPTVSAQSTEEEFQEYISATLLSLGARRWQVDQSWMVLQEPLLATTPLVTNNDDENESPTQSATPAQ